MAAPLPLQNARAFSLGETFYLPRLSGSACPAGAAWELSAAPPESKNRVYMVGAPEPRFTPDRPGSYRFHVPSVAGAKLELDVVAQSPRERFRNHYLPALYGAAAVGDEIWTANGATYTVSRVRRSDAAGQWGVAQEIPVASWPAAIAWKAPLPYVLVAQRGADTVGFVDRERGVLEDALWVGDEPTGLALSPDAATLYVSLPTMRQVAVVDVVARSVVARIDVGFDPRALALSSDGERLFVASYRAGNREKDLKGTYGPNDGEALWVVDTRSLAVVSVVPSLSAVHRALALSDDGAELYVAATDGDPIPSQGDATAKPFVHEAIVLAVDANGVADGGPLRRADLTRQPGSGGPAVSPAAILPRGDTLWISAEASGMVVALDRQTLTEKARATVGAGARQLIALDDGTIAVHCTQSSELWFLDANGAALGSVGLVSEDGRSPSIALGEHVFTRPGGNFGTNHGCASCHTEAENDGMIWRFGTGLWDNVRPLQLLSATTPVGWAAYVSNTQVFGYTGPASIVSRPVTPEEAEGMDDFLASLIGAPRATGRTRLDGSYSDAAARGKTLFESKALCSTCHKPPLYTTREMIPVGKSGVPADVPTLLGVYRHATFFVKAGARTLEKAVDVAADFVGVPLSAAEKSDLVAFLYELTPKGGAPLGIWPDIDSNEGVEPTVTPWVEFADPVDGSRPGTSAKAAATPFVKLQDEQGGDVPGHIEIDGWRVRFVPDATLAEGGSYIFRVLAGLPFLSGGELDAERRSRFQVARAPAATWPAMAQMQVQLAFPPGSAPKPVPLLLDTKPVAAPGDPLRVVIVPTQNGTQQRQPAWLRLDGDRMLMEPFALPISASGVANVSNVVGRVVNADGGVVGRVEGTLRLSGPSVDMSGIPFSIDAMP
jgi:DNA-binding beta-propeller fold protein YncE